MFKIRQEQLDAMLMYDEEKFVDFVIGHLRRECRDSIRDIHAMMLREMVKNGLARARSHGLRRAKDLTAFVSIMFEIAPNFDEQPDIRRALRDETVPVDQRFDSMLERVPDEAWEEAERNKVSEAWFPELLGQMHRKP